MISKELLSAVLGVKVVEIYKEKGEIYRYRRYKEEIDGCHIHNIYELAHKCKEWALKNGYYLTIYNDAIDIVLKTNCKIVENITDGSFNYSPMLVFKACEWILENK